MARPLKEPVLNPKSYDGARVLEASGRPMLVIGRSYWVVPIQEEDVKAEAGTKLAGETTENSETLSAYGAETDGETLFEKDGTSKLAEETTE